MNEPKRREQRLGSLPPRMFLGIILAAGPEGQADFEDARYWVQTAFISNTSNEPDEPAEVTVYPKEREDRYVVRAVTNLHEQPFNTHALSPGQVVSMWVKPDRSTEPAPIRRWLMNVATSTIRWAVVRSFNPDDHWVTVQLIHKINRQEPGEPHDGLVETFGEFFRAACYPVMKGKHFEELVVPGEGKQNVTQGWPVLQLMWVEGLWWISSYTKRWQMPVRHADGYRLDDSNPLKGILR